MSLIGAMVVGRIIWGLVSWALAALFLPNAFTLPMFFAGAFVKAWPGIAAQIIAVPLIVMALEKARLIPLNVCKSTNG